MLWRGQMSDIRYQSSVAEDALSDDRLPATNYHEYTMAAAWLYRAFRLMQRVVTASMLGGDVRCVSEESLRRVITTRLVQPVSH